MQLDKNIEAIPTGHIHYIELAITKYGAAVRGTRRRALFIEFYLYFVNVSRWNIASIFLSNCISMFF